MAEKRAPRILILDIETSLQTVAVFQLGGNDWIRPENLLSERHMISACWQFLGEERVHSVSLLDDPKRFAKDPQDDYHVVKTIRDVMADADCWVAHYGDSFDFKYILTRLLYHNLEPLPPVPTIDTKKIAKNRFYFNSNSLEYVGKYLGLGGKAAHPAGLWLRELEGDKKAIQEMVTYNKRDVTLLKDVFLKLKPYIPNYVNRGLFGSTECPDCGSKNYQHRGWQHAITRSYKRFQCKDCKRWFREARAEKNSTTKYRVL